MALEIVTRTEWGARPPKRIYRPDTLKPASESWLHHTAGSEYDGNEADEFAEMRAIQNFHMNVRGWSDIAYSYVVFESGRAFEGRGWGVAGGHTKGRNTFSHAVCAAGNFDRQQPPDVLLDGIVEISQEGIRLGYQPDGGFTGGHRDAPLASTACPGRYLYNLIPELNERISTPEGDDEDMQDHRITDRQVQTLAEIDNALEQLNSNGTFAAGAVKTIRNGWADRKPAQFASSSHSHPSSGSVDSWARQKLNLLRKRIRNAGSPF